MVGSATLARSALCSWLAGGAEWKVLENSGKQQIGEGGNDDCNCNNGDYEYKEKAKRLGEEPLPLSS